jgi:hypothetical protein
MVWPSKSRSSNIKSPNIREAGRRKSDSAATTMSPTEWDREVIADLSFRILYHANWLKVLDSFLASVAAVLASRRHGPEALGIEPRRRRSRTS